jgi:hypothetical protein
MKAQEQKKPELKTADARPAYFKLPLANLLIFERSEPIVLAA